MNNTQNPIDSIIELWSSVPPSGGEIALNQLKNPKAANYGEFPQWLDYRVAAGLTAMGVSKPYSHQVESWNHLHNRENILVATPTASGKTLCYNIPVINDLLKDSSSRALYLFPTKALARDQESAVRKLMSLSGLEPQAAVYDGDTPPSIRKAAKRDGRIIITNPDMLHTGILPHHTGWHNFFSNLKYIIIDELHQYRGVFGAHVANLIRRLLRIAAFYRAAPLFATCSATIGNPGQLAEAITGQNVKTVINSGAPAGRKHYMIYNPPIVEPVMGVRASTIKTASRMTFQLIQLKITTIVFCQTRRGVEVVLHYLKNKVKKAGLNEERVRGYRGGYLPVLRREIESLLRDGEIDAIVATNALELGIDVGGLDAVVLAGYPGTIAAFHQRSGRAGRRADPSLSLLIANSSPLDQFLVRNSKYLMESPPEHALVAPDNIDILMSHLRCASFELAFKPNETFGSLKPDDTEAALNYLMESGDLSKSKSGYHFVADDYPAASVSLRSGNGKNVVVYNIDTSEPLANVPFHSARFELHEQAIYQHESETYQVEKFDFENSKAFVSLVQPVYYTVAIDKTDIKIIDNMKNELLNNVTINKGDVRVTENMAGFKKVKFGSHENLGYGEIDLPPYVIDTESTWIEIPSSIADRFDSELLSLALQGLEKVMVHIVSLLLMCDTRDIIVKSKIDKPDDDGFLHPIIFLYDSNEGGSGISSKAFTFMNEILADSLNLILGCPCKDGCPACVGPVLSDQTEPKKETVTLIRTILLNSSPASESKN